MTKLRLTLHCIIILQWLPFSNGKSPTRSVSSFLSSLNQQPSFTFRGGDTAAEDVNATQQVMKRNEELQSYRMKQQELLQLRSLILSEMLSKRGLPMATIRQVADMEQPSDMVDWDCAMSTVDEPKSCLYSFDAEPNSKVIAPIDTTKWISLSALNRLRRTDPTKVEPMWHSQYMILQSWFGDGPYSILQHCGLKGLFFSFFLDHTVVLKAFMAAVLLIGVLITFPLLEYMTNRFLVSSTIWLNWPHWARFIHAALPLKLVLGQMIMKIVMNLLGKIEQRLRDTLIEWECISLEERIPVTVGVGSEWDHPEDVDSKYMDGIESDDDNQRV